MRISSSSAVLGLLQIGCLAANLFLECDDLVEGRGRDPIRFELCRELVLERLHLSERVVRQFGLVPGVEEPSRQILGCFDGRDRRVVT